MTSAARHRTEQTYQHRSTLAKIEHVFPAGAKLRIYDVGCGDGRLSRLLLDRGHVVAGLDANSEAVREAKRAGLAAEVGDAEGKWPVRTSSQDVVMLLDILEHTVEPADVLQEAKRVLKPDGSLVLTYLNHFDLRNRLAMLLGRGIVHWDHARYDLKPWSYTHYRYLKYYELRELLASVGFRVEVEQFNFMGGGIIPQQITPAGLRRALVNRWPELLSGKFIVRARLGTSGKLQRVALDHTPPGM